MILHPKDFGAEESRGGPHLAYGHGQNRFESSRIEKQSHLLPEFMGFGVLA
jgi:hypothetical protein